MTKRSEIAFETNPAEPVLLVPAVVEEGIVDVGAQMEIVDDLPVGGGARFPESLVVAGDVILRLRREDENRAEMKPNWKSMR